MSRDILLGVVVGAQGLDGAVKVKTFTENPENFGAYGALHTKDGRKFVIRKIRAAKDGTAFVRFDGVADRFAAEALKGTELFVARKVLPPPQEEEFYYADLIGLAAVDGEGRVLGLVSSLHNFGAGDVIAIEKPDGSDMLLPFTREIVPEIDMEAGRVVIAVPDETSDEEDRK